jgi:hypothetical protein
MKMADYQDVFLWSHFMNERNEPNDTVIKEWKQATKTQFDDRMILDYLKCSHKNYELNEKKAKDIEKARKYFFRAIIVIPFAAVLAIITRLLS